MAKRSILGVMTGKLGNMVGQSNSLVSSKDKQVWRVYNGNVKNPKTVKQAQQRALFVAAKNFKQAFKALLDHSWQGVDYGTKSLNHFEKLVLANGGANYPGFIIQPKGSQDAIPQPFPVSRGSIPFDSSLSFFENDKMVVAGITEVELDAADTTNGAAWTKLLAANPALKDGDMITAIAFVSSDVIPTAFSTMYPVYDRFIIDTQDTTPLVSDCIVSQKGILKLYPEGEDPIQGVFIGGSPNPYGYMGGAAVIISRQKGTKAQWQRSNSDFVVDDAFTSWLMTQDYVNETLDTFMQSTANAESDWYLNETGDNSSDQASSANIVKSKSMQLSNGTSVTGSYYKYNGREGYLYLPGGNLGGYMHEAIYYQLNGTTLTPVECATSVNPDFSQELVAMDEVFETLVAKGYNVTLVP